MQPMSNIVKNFPSPINPWIHIILENYSELYLVMWKKLNGAGVMRYIRVILGIDNQCPTLSKTFPPPITP